MNMPSEFKAAIEAAQGGPVEIIDGDQFALQEMGRKSGWNDASMDVYDALDPRKQ